MAEVGDEYIPETGTEVSVSTEEHTADIPPAPSTSGAAPECDSSAMEVDQPDPPQPDPADEPMPTVEYAISQVVEDDVQSTEVVATEDVSTSADPKPPSAHEAGTPFKKSVVAFAQHYSITNAAERFKVPVASVKKWMKDENVPNAKPKFNSPGQGRKITYSSETDQAIADHIKERIASGEKISVQQVCVYAKAKVREENPQFNASTGWAQRFLLRHGIDLSSSRARKAKKEEVRHTSDIRGRPLSYSSSTDNAIAEYVRSRLSDGSTLSNSELRKYAKELISKENPNFTGSASWAQNFLLRHKINLHTSHSDAEALCSTAKAVSPPPTSSSLSDSLGAQSAELVSTSAAAASSSSYSDATAASVGGSLECVVDDSMKTALAILAGENFDATLLNPAQAAALQSLSELSSDNVSLVDLLSNAQQLQLSEQDGTISLITHGLEHSNTGLYLGLASSEAFGSAFAGATQVDPNTQTPILPQIASVRGQQPAEQEVVQASRPLSYTRETDQQLANWVHSQQATGKKVTFASLRAHAKKLVSNENPHFNASIGWVTPFLLRHNLDLSLNKKKKQARKGSTPRKISSEESDDKLFDEGDSINTSDEGDINDPLSALSQSEVVVAKSSASSSIAQALATQAFAKQDLEPAIAKNPPPIVLDTHAAEGVTVIVTDPPIGAEQTVLSEGDKKPSLKKRQSIRSRHTLSEKLEVVRLMREYNIAAHHVCRMLGLANSTLAGWIKLVQVKGPELEVLSTNRKRANVSGQGRPLSYSKEKDDIIAHWVRSQQQLGIQISSADLAKYATSVISQENNNFTASSGWQQKFLQRHNLQLVTNWQLKATPDSAMTIGEFDKPHGATPTAVEDQQSIPAAVQTEEVVTHDTCSSSSSSLLDKPYSDDIESQLVEWVMEKVKSNGSLSVQFLCRHAEELVLHHNPAFIATLGWAFKFLHRNTLFLDPKPPTPYALTGRKRPSTERSPGLTSTPKKPRSVEVPDMTVSPSTGNLCEALLALSSSHTSGAEGQSSTETSDSIQAAVEAVQSAMQLAMQQAKEGGGAPEEGGGANNKDLSALQSTYFGKPAREFSSDEKEEVVRFANATTLQKAALKYGVAAPTVWRWRVELKLHQPKYTAMQKKYIIKFAETNSLKEAAQRYGITSKTIQNWRKALQSDGELSCLSTGDDPIAQLQGDMMEAVGESPSTGADQASSDVVTYDNQNFQFIVDGGEVMDTLGGREQTAGAGGGGGAAGPVRMDPLEVTNEVDIENVGMEYDVVSSEGHAAKPRCTQQEKLNILQYALEHSVKDASVKFGISPGTLYYWKKSMHSSSSSSGTTRSTELTAGVVSSTADVSLPVSHPTASTAASTDTVMSVQFAGMSGEGSVNVLQELAPPTSSDGASVADQLLSSETASVALSSITSEALQSLPPDINFLQAVSSLLSTAEATLTEPRKQKPGSPRRHGSVSGGISSPTEVLVARPFQTATSSAATQTPPPSSAAPPTADTVATEEEQVFSGGEIVTDSEAPVEATPPSSSDALPQLEPEPSEGRQPDVPDVADVSQTVELSDGSV